MATKKREANSTKETHSLDLSFSEALELKQTGVSSVELKRNSKGVTEITVKCYNSSVIQAAKDAETKFKELSKKFPLPE